MSAKSNIRSFRYSDQVAEILESFEGDSLNAKFENLVLYCYDRLPELNVKIGLYEDWLDRKREELHECEKEILFMNNMIRELAQIQAKLSGLSEIIDGHVATSQENAACSSNGAESCRYCDRFVLYRGDFHDNKSGI